MADVLTVRDEYRAQVLAMLIQKCNSRVADKAGILSATRDFREKLLLLAPETAQPDD